MKLIIDITELMWERLKKHSLNWGDIEDIKDSIREGTPLDDLKAEIKEWYWQADKQAIAKDPCVVDAMVDLFIRTIDKHIGGIDKWK